MISSLQCNGRKVSIYYIVPYLGNDEQKKPLFLKHTDAKQKKGCLYKEKLLAFLAFQIFIY